MEKERTLNKEYAIKLLGFLCPLVYFASYLTRKDYSIVMDAIISSEGINAGSAGLVETLGVISYGAGQIISGILGDRFKPRKLIIFGLSVTVLCNLIMPFAPEGLRFPVWFVNGFAQSMLWPPLVRIMASLMDEKRYNTVAANVNVAGISGTIFVYLTASLIWLKLFNNWRYTFFASAAVSGIILLTCLSGFKRISSFIDIPSKKKEVSEDGVSKKAPGLSFKQLMASGFILIAIGIILQGALRDGITDWVPTLLRNTFMIPSEYAILYAVAIPMLGVISMKVVGIAANKWVKEELNGSAVIFAASAILSFVLLLTYQNNKYLTVILAAVIVGCMHAVNFFLVCVVPAKFEKYGIVATMSGIINSLTYVGTSLAVAGFPHLIKNGDWGPCIIVWVVVSVIGALICLLAVRGWKKFKA
ncbi:MAG: MFS transporter [Lachnospiraceae bacterium]|nr:MFS transporter [Lachnospiraceae bacterium]